MFGFTMPAATKDAVSQEKNAMFKSVLFMPVHACRTYDAATWVPYKGLVDSSGSFVGIWQSWWEDQLKLKKIR